jgi:hypothetical protein
MRELRMGVVGVIVLVLGTAQITMAEPHNSNSIILDEIEYYIQTDKSVYNLGENVEMLYRVTNLRDESVTFGFPHYPGYQFLVEKDGEQIWDAPKGWLQVPTGLRLLPGETREFPNDYAPPLIWPMRDNENNLVDLGTYNVIGGLYGYDYTKVAVPIDIVPEPSSFLLLALGMFLKKRLDFGIIHIH